MAILALTYLPVLVVGVDLKLVKKRMRKTSKHMEHQNIVLANFKYKNKRKIEA
jgi:hypothetical protein